MHKWLAAFLGVTLQVTLAISALACESPEERIIWMDSSKKSAMFIPAKLLQEADWSKLPLKQTDLDSLDAAIRRPVRLAEIKRLYGREEPLCSQPRSSNVGPSKDAKSLRAWMDHFKLTVVGRVEKVVPGWSSWESQVVQMVYVQTLDVLRDESTTTKSNSRLVYRLPFGSFHLKGTQICRDARPDFKAPAEGDTILLLGDPYWADPNFLVFTFAFPIEDGLVQHQSYHDLQEFSPLEVKDLLKP